MSICLDSDFMASEVFRVWLEGFGGVLRGGVSSV